MRRDGPSFHICLDDFVVQVHVIGYRTQGESIVILFKEGGRTLYSIVIDSYCIGEEPDVINKTKELLDNNEVKKLSMLIMTHPHEDHILGMEGLVTSYCDKNTRFYYPSHSFDIEDGIVQLKETEKDVLRLVREKNKIVNTFSNPIGVPAGGDTTLSTVYLYDDDDAEEKRPVPIEIVALTPINSVNDAKRSNKHLDPNDLSISIVINILEYYLFFGADTTNAHISKLSGNTMAAVKFVKIPHHASDTADRLLSYFSQGQLDYACSTSFYVGQSNLPKRDVLNLYANVSQRLDIVGCPKEDEREGCIGEICYKFKLGRTEMLSEVSSNGITEQIK